MTPTNLSEVIFFSLDSSKYKGTDGDYSYLIKELDGQETTGSYKGVQERSIMVDIKELDNVIMAAKHYGQESILVITDKEARLLYLEDMGEETIGHNMVKVSRDEALSNEAYTKFKGAFYLVK